MTTRALAGIACAWLGVTGVTMVGACKTKAKRTHGEAPLIHPIAVDAGNGNGSGNGSGSGAGSGAWPELASFPTVEPERIVSLPTRQDQPRFDVGGPAIVGEIAIVASSQFGFVGVDLQRGAIVWTKPAGAHVAPPLAHGSDVVLVGDCLHAQPVPGADTLLGCVRVVAAGTGADEAYLAIHGDERAIAPFAGAVGTQDLWPAGDHAVRWRRGDHAVVVDLVTGVATPAPADPPPIEVAYKGHTWQIARRPDGATDAGQIVATENAREAWRTERHYTALLSAVWLPDQAPMIRLINQGAYERHSELNLFDVDATGSLHGQVAFPVPGIGLLGYGASSIGDVAIAVRLDASLRRDFVVGYAANSLLMWVYPLPMQARADPVGVALASDAVVVFHDGDTLTILPELSAPPTAPGAARAPSQNPTP